MFLDDTPGRTCRIEGKEYLFFSGYGYLGMNFVDAFREIAIESIQKYGILFPSSRNSNTNLALFTRMEDSLSALTAMEDSVLFSSGFLAGQSIASILATNKNIFTAPGTHPCLNSYGTRKPEGDFHEWAEHIVSYLTNSTFGECILVSDSVNIFESRVHDFSFVQSLPSRMRIIFVVDDSHGIGILGENGNGISSLLPPCPNVEYILSYSLSKAFGIAGGAVSASKKCCDLLRAHPGYSGSTPISPALANTFLESTHLYQSQKLELEKNIKALNAALKIPSKKFQLPIYICGNEHAEKVFLENGIVISAFRYPYPTSTTVSRIVLNALHISSDMENVASVWHQLH